MPPGAERMDAGVAAVCAATPLGVGQARDRFDGLDGLSRLSFGADHHGFSHGQMLFAEDVARLSITRGTTGLPAGLHLVC